MTTDTIGTIDNPLRVAIIGAGPSGFYAADALLKQSAIAVEIDMFDRLPTPYGLVRGGVAPDHQKIKSVTKVYEKIAAHPSFRLYGNVEFGRELADFGFLDGGEIHDHGLPRFGVFDIFQNAVGVIFWFAFDNRGR